MAKFSFRSHPLLSAVGVMAIGAVAWWKAEPVLMHMAAQAILKSQGAPAPPVTTSMQAPDFALHDADGKTVRLSDFRGKVVLLNFWATWCGPCKLEIPWFIEFQNRYQAEGFTVLGVSMDESGWPAVRPYVAEARMNYPVVLGDEKINLLYGGIEALPTTLILDRKGNVQQVHTGLIGKDRYRDEILALLRK